MKDVFNGATRQLSAGGAKRRMMGSKEVPVNNWQSVAVLCLTSKAVRHK